MSVSKSQLLGSFAKPSAKPRKSAKPPTEDDKYPETPEEFAAMIRDFESYHYFVSHDHKTQMVGDLPEPLESVVLRLLASIVGAHPDDSSYFDLAVGDVSILLNRRVVAIIDRGPDGRPVVTLIGAAKRKWPVLPR